MVQRLQDANQIKRNTFSMHNFMPLKNLEKRIIIDKGTTGCVLYAFVINTYIQYNNAPEIP